MESRWMSGCVRSPAHNICANYLAASTNIFSADFVRSLIEDLKSNTEQLARELGYSADAAADGLYSWCNSPGSTVFVLVSVLGNLGRMDCVNKIEQYIMSHAMQLFIKVELAATDVPPTATSPQFHQIITCCEFSLLQALENVLGEALVYYDIVGPGSWVVWTTLAKELKGQQLTLLRHSQPVPRTRAALCEALEPDTELKQPVVTQNIQANEETHFKALSCTQIENLKLSQESSIQISNSNNITLSGSLNKEEGSFGSLTAEGPTKTHSHPSLDSKDYLFSPEQQPQVKAMIVSKQNTPEYAQVKHFPDKHFYKDSISKGSNQGVMTNQVHPMEVLDNVPHLSLFEENISHHSASSQRTTLQHMPEETQMKLNNLNCVASASSKNSMDFQTIPKSCNSGTAISTVITRPIQKFSQVQNSSYSANEVGDQAVKIPVLSETNMAEFEKYHAGNSLFTQDKNAQGIHFSVFPPGGTYLPHTCIQPVDRQQWNSSSTIEHGTSLPCGNSYFMTAPPQKRHRNGQVTPSPVSPAEPQHGRQHYLQQQTVLDQTMKMNHLQQSQPVSTSPQITPSNILSMQNHFYQDAKAHLHPHPQEQHGKSPDENSPSKIIQNQNQQMSQQQLHYHQQLQNQQNSQQETQSSISPFLKATASPFLICHTPPPGFPDEQMMKDINDPGTEQRQLTQYHMFDIACFHQEAAPASQSIGKLNQETKMDTRSEQYITMFQAVPHGIANPGLQSSSVKSQTSQGQSTITLQNTQFINGSLHNPQNFPRSGSHFESVFASSSSGRSTVCPGLTRGDPSVVHTEDQNAFMTPQPFHPAPPVFDALGRRINTSTIAPGTFRNDLGATTLPQQYGYSSANVGQFVLSEPVTNNHCQASPMTAMLNLEAELLHLDGWCPHENGDTIQRTMEKYRSQDGNYIIWKSRRMQKFVISVSHLNQLFHFRVEEMKPENNRGTVYYLFEGGYMSDSFLSLVHHYRLNGIKSPMQSAGKKKTYIEIIKLRCPLRVKLEMKRKDTSSLNDVLKRKDVSQSK